MKVLVVEDDDVLRDTMTRVLRKEGLVADCARTGPGGLQKAIMGSYGLIILDIMLPGMDGVEVCKKFRSAGRTESVLMLTAKDAVEDRVKGLDSGADDYLVKPFDFTELMARVRALGRREAAQKKSVLQVRDLEIDTVARSAKRGGKDLALTRREYDLVEALARNLGRTLTREAILDHVWNDDEIQSGSVNFHVAQLRRKLDDGFDVKLVHTVHGIGYVMKSGD